MNDEGSTASGLTVTRIPIPRFDPPTQEEIERRRELFAKVMALREQIGPSGIATDELIHQVRMEADGLNDE